MDAREKIHQKFADALRELASCDDFRRSPELLPVTSTEKYLSFDMDSICDNPMITKNISETKSFPGVIQEAFGDLPIRLRVIVDDHRITTRAHERDYTFRVSSQFGANLIDTIDGIFEGHKLITQCLEEDPDAIASIKHS